MSARSCLCLVLLESCSRLLTPCAAAASTAGPQEQSEHPLPSAAVFTSWSLASLPTFSPLHLRKLIALARQLVACRACAHQASKAECKTTRKTVQPADLPCPSCSQVQRHLLPHQLHHRRLLATACNLAASTACLLGPISKHSSCMQVPGLQRLRERRAVPLRPRQLSRCSLQPCHPEQPCTCGLLLHPTRRRCEFARVYV